MADKSDLPGWILQALRDIGGSGTVVEVTRRIWEVRETELRGSGTLFYTWQYDLRWAAQKLRHSGKLRPVKRGAKNKRWTLAGPPPPPPDHPQG